MAAPPKDIAEAFAQWEQLRKDIDFARALRRLTVPTTRGDIMMQYQPGAANAVLDLRGLSGSGEVPAVVLPDQAGHANQLLFTDGATTFWASPGAEYDTWVARVTAAGGTYTTNSKRLAAILTYKLRAASFFSKIKYLLPLLGGNLTAARIPLIDTLGVGIATNNAFVDADFSESAGLQGDGTAKYLDSLIKASQLGASANGGLGWWESNFIAAGNVEPIGAYSDANTERYTLDLRSTFEAMRWGAPPNGPQTAASAVNAHYYGQRSGAAFRAIFRNGSSVATNTTNDTAAGISERNIYVGAANIPALGGGVTPWPGRCACAYMTDGTLTDAEVAAIHTILDTCLITPTAR